MCVKLALFTADFGLPIAGADYPRLATPAKAVPYLQEALAA